MKKNLGNEVERKFTEGATDNTRHEVAACSDGFTRKSSRRLKEVSQKQVQNYKCVFNG